MISSVANNRTAIVLRKKEKPITMIICELSILKALPDTESAFGLSLVIISPPSLFYICLYVLKLYLLLILNNNNNEYELINNYFKCSLFI